MTKKIQADDIIIRYKVEGKGFPVFLLHGYLESLAIWDNFAPKLAKKYKVIRLDLPGHGESYNQNEVNTMDDMADGIFAIFQKLETERAVMIGHSMGGYVTLAFAEKFPKRLAGFSLFHSSPFADNDEKKANRKREIELVDNGKKDLIAKTNIPKQFANDNLEKFSAEINRAIKIAVKTTDEGIKSALKGMMERPERSEILDLDIPKLMILGKKDNYINFDMMFPILNHRKKGRVEILENSGHIGFIEEKEKSLKVVNEFIETCKNHL